MKTFKRMCLHPVVLALSLIATCVSSHAADDSVEEPTAVEVHAGFLHSLFLMADGSVWGAGSNLTGALGTEGYVRSMPWIMMTDVSAASAGNQHSLFLKRDGSVWAVGIVGPLGDGFYRKSDKEPHTYDTENGEGMLRLTPVRVMEGVEAISAGRVHSLFLKTDGSAWAAGENADGRLGDGTTSAQANPVLVMNDVAAISAGFHSLFLKKDGSAWAAGRNDKGQLGDGTTTNRAEPVQVMNDVVAISAGFSHSLFLKGDGTVWASGENTDGRLGDGTETNRLRPVQVLTQVTAVSAGEFHSLFLKKDGSVWGTGDNRLGPLGDALWDLYPTDRKVISPVRIIDGVASVSAGSGYSLFVMTNGSVMASGENLFSNLGFDGRSTEKPVKVDFRKRTPAEIEEWEDRKKELEKIPFDPETQLPIMTKPPRLTQTNNLSQSNGEK